MKNVVVAALLSVSLVTMAAAQGLSLRSPGSQTNQPPKEPVPAVQTSVVKPGPNSPEIVRTDALPPQPLKQTAPTANNYGQPMVPAAKNTAPYNSYSPPKSTPYTGYQSVRQPSTTQMASMMERLDDQRRLKMGDIVAYRVLEDRSDTLNLTVTESGVLDIPLVGQRHAAGKTCRQLAFELRDFLKKDYYYEATVMLELSTPSKFDGKFYVYGQVATPGTHDFPVTEVMTLSRAITKAGGLKEGADKTQITVLRRSGVEGDKEFVVNLSDIMDKGRTDLDIELMRDDYIMVPQDPTMIKGRIYLYGQVNGAGVQEIPGGEPYTLSKAILRAGGFGQFADKRRVKIFRKTGKSEKEKPIVVDLVEVFDKGRTDKDVLLLPGDYVMVPQRLVNF